MARRKRLKLGETRSDKTSSHTDTVCIRPVGPKLYLLEIGCPIIMNKARKVQSTYFTPSLENVLINPWDLVFLDKGGYRQN